MKIKISRYINILGLSILIIGFVFMSFPSKSLADTLVLSFAGQFENGENGYSQAYSITLDTEGNIYTTGYFGGTVDFDPSANTYNLTSSNNASFISILASDGSFIGAYKIGYGENGGSEAYSITLDEQGNIYTTGQFYGIVDFDPSGNTYNLTSNGSSFISILASDGSFIGAYQFENGENSGSGAYSITLDEQGNIYTTGQFYGIVDFDPSGNTYNLTSNNGSAFISILASDGSFIGAYQFENGENSWSQASSITLDTEGNIYTTGSFGGTVDFDPSEETYNLTSSNDSAFISILASDGSFIGAYQFENGENSWSYARSITLDEQGNIYTTGGFSGTVDFDPSGETHELTSSNGKDSSFISILASDGSFVGAYQFENGENGGSGARSITLDEQGNIYTTGYFGGTVDFDPGEGEYNLNGCVGECGNAFISKLSSGGSFIGAYQFENGENGGSGASSITLDEQGNIYTTGSFGGTVDFDPSGEEYNLNSPNNNSAFITKLSPQEEEPGPTPTHHRIKSSGSSVGAISTFYQEQYQRALAVGADTTPYLQALNNLNPNTTTSPDTTHRTLKQGMQGDDVKQLQIYLNTHNYPLASTGIGSPNNETTYFGNKTKQAVILFQKANNLTPDGIVGPLTWSYIK